MGRVPQRLDPDRRRRRLELLARLADAKAQQDRVLPRQQRGDRLHDLIATRRHLRMLIAIRRRLAG